MQMHNRFPEHDSFDVTPRTSDTAWPHSVGRWTVVIPFHNERLYLPGCLKSLAAQTVRPRLILVDNGSLDHSADVAQQTCDQLGLEALHLFERRPGKVAALQCGLAAVATEFVATCDADTIYPESYLETATRLLDRQNAVAAVAATSSVGAPRLQTLISGLRMEVTAAVLKQQCLNGGAGQVFRTAELRACGGFDPAIWNWVLEDHEIMARIEQFGTIVHYRGFHCHPAERARGIDCSEWDLAQRIQYHMTTRRNRLSFFHEVLAPRLQQRCLSSERLRRVAAVPTGA